jgi:hypothetical protein
MNSRDCVGAAVRRSRASKKGIPVRDDLLNGSVSRFARSLALATVLAGVFGGPGLATAAEPKSAANSRLALPASRLNRSPDEAPVVFGTLGLGGAFDHDQGQPVVGGGVIFRPAEAAGFLDFLYDWNTGMVLQAERLSLGQGGRTLSADLILRRYQRLGAGTGNGDRVAVPFWGGGIGASSADGGEDAGALPLKYWSLVAEYGREWRFASGRLLMVKGQLRYFHKGGVDYTAWTVAAGAGLPFPF